MSRLGDIKCKLIMIFLPAEENVSTEPTVVSTGEDLQDSPLPVAHHVELGQGHLRRNRIFFLIIRAIDSVNIIYISYTFVLYLISISIK